MPSRNMKATQYYQSGQQAKNLANNRRKMKKIKNECQFCKKILGVQIKRHEMFCYMNPLIRKDCPVCGKPCKHPKYRTTCSYVCSNTLYRSGENNPNWKEETYRTTCFLHHKKECIVCGESNIVAVHHWNENHEDNTPSNLIPLCPTHHQYCHSRFKNLIESQILKYISDWKNGPGGKI